MVLKIKLLLTLSGQIYNLFFEMRNFSPKKKSPFHFFSKFTFFSKTFFMPTCPTRPTCPTCPTRPKPPSLPSLPSPLKPPINKLTNYPYLCEVIKTRSHSLSPNVKRRISEQLAKNKHLTNALSARPPTCLTRPTRLKPPSLPSPLKSPHRQIGKLTNLLVC